MKDLDIKITGEEFFRIVNGEEMHGLKFIKRVDIEQLTPKLSFFHRYYYFDWNGKKVVSGISSVFWGGPTQDFHCSFTHSDGEPSETGPKFALSHDNSLPQHQEKEK